MTSLLRKKSVDTMFACCLHCLVSLLVTFLLTASAFALKDPLRKRMSRTVGVVCAMAECSGDLALAWGWAAIVASKYVNSSLGLLVLAQR